jgi:hypothetical protein
MKYLMVWKNILLCEIFLNLDGTRKWMKVGKGSKFWIVKKWTKVCKRGWHLFNDFA